jgi:hypothetical protein
MSSKELENIPSEEAPTKKLIRPTKAQFQIRIRQLIKLKLKGYTRSELADFGRKKWGVGPDVMDDMGIIANKRIAEYNEETIADDMNLITGSYWNLYRIAFNNIKKDKSSFALSLCVGILKEITRVKGLDDQTVVRPRSTKRKLEDLSDEVIEVLYESKK